MQLKAFIGMAAAMSSAAFAAPVPAGFYSQGTIDLPSTGFVDDGISFDGTAFSTSGAGMPIGSAEVSVGGIDNLFAGLRFQITSGFNVTGTVVLSGPDNTINNGDTVSTNLSAGAFRIYNPSLLGEPNLVSGSFDSATVTSTIGSQAALQNFTTNGLSFTPGPLLTFENGTFVSAITGQLSFLVQFTGTTVSVSNATQVGATSVFTATLDGFGNADVFTRVSGDFTVVPEPTTLTLLGLSVAGLLARRRRA